MEACIGNYEISSAVGNYELSSATGDYGRSSVGGFCGISATTGSYGTSSTIANCGVAVSTGYCGNAIAGDSESVAVVWGYHGKAKGVLGSHLVFAEWDEEKPYWMQYEDYLTGNEGKIRGAKMVRIDGKNIKENVWYTMVNGKIVEAK